MGFPIEFLLGQFFSGLMRASFLCLVTAGLTLVYGILGVLNVAHVSFYMLGAYLTCTLWKLFGAQDFSYWVAIPMTCLATGTLGLVIERILVRRLLVRPAAQVLVATYSLIYILGDVAKLTWGLTTYSIQKPRILTRAVLTVGAASFPASVAYTIAVAIVVLALLWYWLNRTRFGSVVVAVQCDREMAAALGIDVPRVYTIVFSIGVVLAGLAGAVWVGTGSVERGMLDVAMLPQVFCTMVTGGMGSLAGTPVAALVLGEAYSLSILIAAKAAMIAPYIVTALVLLYRPWGLLGVRGRFE